MPEATGRGFATDEFIQTAVARLLSRTRQGRMLVSPVRKPENDNSRFGNSQADGTGTFMGWAHASEGRPGELHHLRKGRPRFVREIEQFEKKHVFVRKIEGSEFS